MRPIRNTLAWLREPLGSACQRAARPRATPALLSEWERGGPVRTAAELAGLVAAQRQAGPVSHVQAPASRTDRPRPLVRLAPESRSTAREAAA